MRRRSVLTSTAVFLSGLCGAALPALAVHATVEQPVRSGDVVVVDGANRQLELERGGSDTKWTLRLPAGAACPGDSMHDEWRVQSFIVPSSVDPSSLTYESTKPAGEGNYGLYDYRTHPFIQQLTRANDVAGQPGVVGDIPTLSFAVFPPGTLPGGEYRIGVACTLQRGTAVYWDTALVIVDTPSDQPAQLTWHLSTASAVGPLEADDGSANGVFYAIAAAAAIGISALLWRRRASSTPRTKELT